MDRRHLIQGALAAASGLACGMLSGCVRQDPLNVIVPFPPGGGGDVLARRVLEPFSHLTQRSVVISNKPGAGGNIGTKLLKNAVPNGKNFGYLTNGIYGVNPVLYDETALDPTRDLKVVMTLSRIPLLVVLNPKALGGIRDMNSFIDYAYDHPGIVPAATAGVGTTGHLAQLLLRRQTGANLNLIPHKGGAAALTEVLAGRIPFMIDVLANVRHAVQRGDLIALAVLEEKETPLAEGVPTLLSQGIDVVLTSWDGIAAPLNTPSQAIDTLQQGLLQTLQNEGVQKGLRALGAEPMGYIGDQLTEFLRAEAVRWNALAWEAKKAMNS